MEIAELYLIFKSCNGVTTDSRKIPQNSIFFALKGNSFNGNKFAEQALKEGAAFAIVDEEVIVADYLKHRVIKVANSLETLHSLGLYHREHTPAKIIALTGSNGKTTTKELIATVLQKKYKTHATKGNLNNHIGIPLTLLSMPDDTEIAVIEMGANHQKEIESYCKYTNPEFGLITNIGKAHLEGFGGEEGVLKGKTELYDYLGDGNGKIFISDFNEKLKNKAYGFFRDDHSFIFYGTNPNSLISGTIQPGSEFLNLSITAGNTTVELKTNLVGEYNFENVLAAACIGNYFGISLHEIKDAIESYMPTNNRSQKIRIGNNEIILDAYNANPSSMNEALKAFDKIDSKNKIVILGEMMELGENSKDEHDKITSQVLSMSLQLKVFTGTGFAFLSSNKDILYFENTDALKDWYNKQQFQNTIQLIKGSRKNKLETILEAH